MFSLRDIVLNYGDQKVLEQFSLNGDRQQFITLYGLSGVGKTSILNLLAKLTKPQAGKVNANFQQIAYVFQKPRLIPWLTVRLNLHAGLHGLGLEPKERNERVENLLHLMDLAEFSEELPGKLTGDMKHRLSVGCAFIVQPDLLLLDEPFNGLDANLKKEMQELLILLKQWHSCTTVMVTRDVNEAVKLSDRIVVVKGRPCQVVLNLYPEPDMRLKPSYAKKIKQSIAKALEPLETMEYA